MDKLTEPYKPSIILDGPLETATSSLFFFQVILLLICFTVVNSALYQVQCATNQELPQGFSKEYANSKCFAKVDDWKLYGVIILQTVVLFSPILLWKAIFGRQIEEMASLLRTSMTAESPEKQSAFRQPLKHIYNNRQYHSCSVICYFIAHLTSLVLVLGAIVWHIHDRVSLDNIFDENFSCNVSLPFNNSPNISFICVHPAANINEALWVLNISLLGCLFIGGVVAFIRIWPSKGCCKIETSKLRFIAGLIHSNFGYDQQDLDGALKDPALQLTQLFMNQLDTWKKETEKQVADLKTKVEELKQLIATHLHLEPINYHK